MPTQPKPDVTPKLDAKLRAVRSGVDELRTLTGAIAAAVADRPGLGRDVERLRSAVTSMDAVTSAVGTSLGESSAEQIAELRHDLRVHLATYKGYAELLVEELQDRFPVSERSLRCFEDAKALSNEMLAVITALRVD